MFMRIEIILHTQTQSSSAQPIINANNWKTVTMIELHSTATITTIKPCIQQQTNPFNSPCPGLTGSAGTRKVQPIWIWLKQETVSGTGISWAICKFASRSQTDNHASTLPLSFLQAGCPSYRTTNSVKALKPCKIHSVHFRLKSDRNTCTEKTCKSLLKAT